MHRLWIHFRSITVASLLVFASVADARTDKFALGAMLGEPVALSLRGKVHQNIQIASNIGYGFFPKPGPLLNLDVHFELYDFLKNDKTLGLIFSIAPRITFAYYPKDAKNKGDRDKGGIGMLAVFTLRLLWRDAPFEIVFDMAPVGVMSTTDGNAYYDFDFGLGFRYCF
jgi:hypothetical protein